MKAFIQSIIFASIATCAIAPVQAGIVDSTKKAAATTYRSAKSAINSTYNFLMSHKIIGIALLAASAACAKRGINASGELAKAEALANTFYYSIKDIAKLKNMMNVCYIAAASLGATGLYNISR